MWEPEEKNMSGGVGKLNDELAYITDADNVQDNQADRWLVESLTMSKDVHCNHISVLTYTSSPRLSTMK